jgi:phosphoglycolate phosphatase-like HAD superfamily hydrolase
MQLLAMDFDGVIADSISECAVAGYNGYEAYCGNNIRIKTPEEIKSDELNKFRIMRPYIRSGEDYIYLFHALNDGIIIDSQKDFDEFHIAYFDRKESYYQLFYSARQTLMSSNRDNWITLNPLYNGMDEFLQSMQNKIHIVSTKASKYIIEILKSNGVKFNPKRVHEADRGFSKTDIIIRLMREYNLSTSNMIFIDDHFDTLRKIKSTGVRCMFAGWGYNTNKQRSRCHKLSLELVDLQQFYKEFTGL